MFRATLNSFSTTASRMATKSLPLPYKQIFWMSTSSESTRMCDKMAFIGAGKMAQAMILPMIKKGYQPEERVAVYDVSTAAVKSIQDSYPNIQTASTIKDAVKDADMVVLAVKPQNISESFWAQFPEKNEIREDATILSILAGTPVSALKPSGFPKIVRAMPNTPATIGEGMSVWCCTPNLTQGDRKVLQKLLNTLGKAIYVDDEKFVDMSTSISGSGPAYIFMLMEAMIDSGVHMGFSRETATTLVHHTLLGSTLYAMETGEHPAILRNMVTSPAGTTASAIYELESGKFRVVINDAIWACYRRSLELGGQRSMVGPGRPSSPEPVTKSIIHHHYPAGEMIPGSDSDSDDESKK